MLVVTYDVNVSTPEGAHRLRQVAKACERCGGRVQNSVFEINVDAAHLAVLKAELGAIMDPEKDSIRFYRLGNSYTNKIDIMGRHPRVEAGSPLMF